MVAALRHHVAGVFAGPDPSVTECSSFQGSLLAWPDATSLPLETDEDWDVCASPRIVSGMPPWPFRERIGPIASRSTQTDGTSKE